jgi:predicted transcriptional regulator YheO
VSLIHYTPLCDALVLLLKPLVEIVIHDIESDTICYINGDLSKRQVGDPSLLGADELKAADPHKDLATIVYPKLNFDGRIVRSISVPLEGKWLLCINCDVSVFNQMHSLSQHFLKHNLDSQPASLFKNDWQEKLHNAIHLMLLENGWKFDMLTGKQKKSVVHHLFVSGAFAEKNAADYIAETLGLGRATVFKYLKEWR